VGVLACPTDLLTLTRQGATWVCPNAHSYDVAREGYVNLLPPGRPSRRSAGDDKDSVAARRRFLNAGYYASLADRVATMVAALAPRAVLDVGCGEG
jgi:23S rRNA (guanine745-N1)-methyltransferase